MFHVERLHRIAMTGLKDAMAFIMKKQFPYCATVGWMYVTNHLTIFDAATGWIVPSNPIPWWP